MKREDNSFPLTRSLDLEFFTVRDEYRDGTKAPHVEAKIDAARSAAMNFIADTSISVIHTVCHAQERRFWTTTLDDDASLKNSNLNLSGSVLS